MTLDELQKLLPDSAVESTCSGEVVVYTGWALDHANPDGPLVEWCEACESGADLPDDGCGECGREPRLQVVGGSKR